MRKGIFVLGTPSGGTSCVAGVLHHLGVDMGNVSPNPEPRGYVVYECRDLSKLRCPVNQDAPFHQIATRHHVPVTVSNLPAGLAINMELYLEGRARNAVDQPWGVKTNSLFLSNVIDPITLPVEWLVVDRSLDDTILSDAYYTAMRYTKAGEGKVGRNDECKRMEAITAMWYVKSIVANQVEAFRVPYAEGICAEPNVWIAAIAERFDLHPTYEQTKAAIDFVRPGRREE